MSLRAAAISITSLLALGLAACESEELTVRDIPLGDGLAIAAHASACQTGNRFCPVRVVVNGPPDADEAELVARERAVLVAQGWAVSEVGGQPHGRKGELQIEVTTTARWATHPDDPARPAIGIELARAVRV